MEPGSSKSPDDDIWVYSLKRGTLERQTSERGPESSPIWTPDGTRLTYFSGGTDGPGIFWRPADGTGTAERLTTGTHVPHSWSLDLGRLVFLSVSGVLPKTRMDLAVITPKEKKVEPLVATTANERNGDVSPDGRWLAYLTDETGQNEVFVRPFPGAQSGRWRISTDGAGEPLWAPDSRTLFYLRGQAMMAVSVGTGPPSGLGRATETVRGLVRCHGPDKTL